MTIKSRTIDNLGIEASSRYAKDKQLDTKLVEESRFIPLKTEVTVLKPYLPTELEEYLLPQKLTLWASFEAPPQFFAETANPLFSYQLIPSVGGYEEQEADLEKLEALEDTINKQFSEGNGRDQEEGQEEEKERKTLLALLQTIGKLDRTLTLINSRRYQYQRG